MPCKYCLVTPAFNEAQYIETTIQGVLAQTVLPQAWVIVDDGSTDDTPAIIKHYAAQHPWIQYVRREKDAGQSYYASNVYAILTGLERIKENDGDFLAILDADISLPPDYYARILSQFEKDTKLGIASGVYVDRIGDNKFRKVLNDRRSTPKALMVFRKECYKEIGGFLAMKYGGEDTVACFTARMKGWKVWSFPDIVAIHNKPVGSGHAASILKIRFRQGYGEFFLATHPLFMLLKSLRRCAKEPPYIIGGLVRLAGYISACFSHEKRQMPDEVIRYIQKEQVGRIIKGNRVPQWFHVNNAAP
jgi:glycosyltransferase involved in cell wall biosynthesis